MKGGYEEGGSSSSNAVHPQSENEWAPMYIYYNWNQTDPNFKVKNKN